MEKIKEDLSIEIKETEKDSVKDYVVSLNTMMSGKVETTTPKINGCLKALILSTNHQVQIVISLKDHPEIVLFEAKDYSGKHYIPLRISPVSKSANSFNFGPTDWYLNDELNVSISGQLNTKVDCIFRWVNG